MSDKNHTWVVRMKCSVTKELIVEGCTEEQARTRPYDFIVEERETGQDDFEVTKVEPNE